MGEAWGSRAVDVLNWSYGMMCRSEASLNFSAIMMANRAPSTASQGLSFMDRRAQAAVVRQEIDRIPGPAGAHLGACHLPRPVKERRAEGWELVDTYKQDREQRIIVVAQWMYGQENIGYQTLRGLAEIERQYALGRHNIHRVAKHLRKRFETAKEVGEQATRLLDALYQNGLTALDARLVEMGLIASSNGGTLTVMDARRKAVGHAGA